MKFYKTLAAGGLYGAETWVLTSKDKSRIQASEMRFLRSVVGVTRRDRVRNVNIRHSLNIYNLNDKISQYRQNWRFHVEGMSDNRLPKLAYNYRPKGYRNEGRPRKRWKDQE